MKTIRARKTHKCFECDFTIYKGEECIYDTIYVDKFYLRRHFCKNCITDFENPRSWYVLFELNHEFSDSDDYDEYDTLYELKTGLSEKYNDTTFINNILRIASTMKIGELFDTSDSNEEWIKDNFISISCEKQTTINNY